MALRAARGPAGVGIGGGGGREAGEVAVAAEEHLFGEEDWVFDVSEEGDGGVAFGVEGRGGGHDLTAERLEIIQDVSLLISVVNLFNTVKKKKEMILFEFDRDGPYLDAGFGPTLKPRKSTKV